MSDEGPIPAQEMFDFIQRAEANGQVFDSGSDQPNRGLLRSFFTVAEFIGDDGERWLVRISWGMDGKRPPTWEIVGMLETSLFEMKLNWAEG